MAIEQFDDFDFQGNGVWSLWVDMGININNSKNITPIYYAGKLMLFWVELKKVNSSTVSSKASTNSAGTGEVKTNNLDIYQATVKHSFLKEDESWEIAQTLIADEVVYVDDKQDIGVNRLEKSNHTHRLFSGLFTDMNSDDWNTVYVSHIDNDIAVSFKCLPYQLSMVRDMPTMVVTGNGESGFDSGEGA